MASNALATAFVNIVPGTAALEDYLKKGLPSDAGDAGTDAGQKMGVGMGGKLKSVMGPMIAGLAASFSVVGITNFLKDTVNAASSFEAEFEGVNQTFGEGAKVIQDYAKQASKLAGVGETDALRAAKSFGVYGKAAGLSSVANAEFSKTLLQTAGDLGSFYDIPTGDALDAIAAGLRGESEPLRRFGILLNQDAIEAQGMAMGLGDMVKHGKTFTYTMTEQEKILARNAVILDQVGVAQGDFVKYSDTYGNAIKTAGAEFENVKNKIGQALLPTMATLANFAVSTLIPAFEKISAFFIQFGPVIAAFVGTIAAYNAVMTVMAIVTNAETMAQWALNLAWLANPMTYVILGIAALVAAIVWIATQTTWFQDIWTGMVDIMTTAWNWLWTNALKPVFDLIGAAFKILWDYWIHPVITMWLMAFALVATAATWLWENAIAPALGAMGKFFGYVWKSFIKPFVDFVIDAFNTIGKTATNIFNNVSKLIGDVFGAIVGIIRGPVNGVIDLLNTMISALNSIKIDVPDWVPEIGGQSIGFNIPRIPKLAAGGYVDRPTTALIGEAGPEVVTPLKDFERMMNMNNGNGNTINYYAAPNQSVDSEQALFTAIKRAKVVAAW